MGMPIIVPGTTTRTEAINNIIESISLQEFGLAHVLNAEGEKINTIVNNPLTTADQLLCINKSAKGMVDSVSRLEIILQTKLNRISCNICPPCN